MSSTPEPVVRESDDEILTHSHELRKRIVNKLTNNGTAIPVDDRAQMTALIQTLDGMDRQALGNKRIKVEEQANRTQEQAASTIASLLQAVTAQRPFEQAIPVVAREVPTLPATVPPPQLVEGETAVTAQQHDYDSFQRLISPDGKG